MTFLSVPVWHVGLHSRVATYEPWGSDYYVIKETMPASVCSGCTDLSAAVVATEPTNTSSPEDKTGLYVAIGVLAGVAALALITAVYSYMSMKKKAVVANTGKGVAMQTSATAA
mgnify:CR=1 FL=1